MNKTTFFLSTTLLFGVSTQSFATKRAMMKLFQRFTKHFYCRILVDKPGFRPETINCDDCLFGAGKKGYYPFEGCCGNFIWNHQETFPCNLERFKKTEV